MSPHTRIREGVGRVTPCAPSSQRKQTFASGNVRSACTGLPALPTLRRARSRRPRFRLFPQNRQLTAAQPRLLCLTNARWSLLHGRVEKNDSDRRIRRALCDLGLYLSRYSVRHSNDYTVSDCKSEIA